MIEAGRRLLRRLVAGVAVDRSRPGTSAAVGIALVALPMPLVLGDFGLFLAASIMAAGVYAAGYDLAYGYTGLLSFGHGVFFGTGAYAAALVVRDLGVGTGPALLGALLAGGLSALLVGLVAVRVGEHGFVIVTIIFVLLANLAALSWSSVTGGSDGFSIPYPALFGTLDLFDPLVRYYVLLAALLGTLLVLGWLVRTPAGLAFRLIRENERRARLLGYPTGRYRLGSLTASGAVAGLAGALSSVTIGYVSASNYSIATSADALVFALVGGRGTLVGPVIGALVVEGFAEGVSGVSTVYPLLVGALLAVVVVYEREGIVGALGRLRDRLRRRDDRSS